MSEYRKQCILTSEHLCSDDYVISMSEIQNQVKEIMVRGLKEILHPHVLPEQSKTNIVDVSTLSTIGNDVVLSKNLSKSVKSFVEYSLSNEIDSQLKDIGDTHKETWKIDAHNLSKLLLEQPKLSCVQDNLTNILDSCLKEVSSQNLKYSNDPDLDISPLLQPEHIIDVAECISAEKPLDVRLNALRVLLKSHFIEVVNGEGWYLLQKKLVENLCDSNAEIFITCLKVHVKLASCSSPLAIKECVLNLLESLGQHYFLKHGECKAVSIQSMHFHRMVHITSLLLDTFKEATLNIARFGESKLDEMIDNFLQLLSVHVPSKQSRNKIFLSPLEVVSYLDPHGKWLTHLTHFTLSRRLFFLSLCKNITFLRMAVEEIVSWCSEPVIPSRNTSKVSQGELNVAVHKFSFFCHSLAVFTTISSYGVSCTLFPVSINKNEDQRSVEDILRMLITLLSDARFNDMLLSKGTEMCKRLMAQCIAKLLCLKEVNGCFFILMLLRTVDNQDPLDNPIKVQILDRVSQYNQLNNPFVNSDLRLKRKLPIFLHCFISTTNSSINHNRGSTKQRRDIERQGSLSLPSDSNDVFPFEVFLKSLINKLKNTSQRDGLCLVQIATLVLKDFDRLLGVNYTLRAQSTRLIVEIYLKLEECFKIPDSKFNNSDVELFNCCAQFLLQAAASSLGFYMLQESSVILPLLLDRLHQPIVNWSDPVWLMFISKAATTSEGCRALASESNVILREELARLWITIDEDCSGSALPTENTLKQMLSIVVPISLTLGAVKALLNESTDGSDITLTDECDIGPSNLFSIVQNFALNAFNCPGFVHHHFALTILEILISNIDSRLYLQHKFKYEELLLQSQIESRVEEGSEVIIDECSLLRQRIIEQTFLPGRLRGEMKPTHVAPRPESTLSQSKFRSRGTGEFTRWLSETRLGLHDNNWLKHARKLYRSSSPEDVKGSTILDLLEQVVKVLPETRTAVKWKSSIGENVCLEPEDELAVQLVLRYGAQHRLIQSTQQNFENFTQLVLLTKTSLNDDSNSFEGFDWVVASAYLMCSGNIEKSQSFLSLVSCLPTASILWLRLGEPSFLAQMGNVLETIVAEEAPALLRVLQRAGFSWWQLCRSWIAQCWWNMLDWPQICHWFTLSILHQLDHSIYFCVALLLFNQDRLLRMSKQNTMYELIINPVEKFQLGDARGMIEKLYKKYHNILHSQMATM